MSPHNSKGRVPVFQTGGLGSNPSAGSIFDRCMADTKPVSLEELCKHGFRPERLLMTEEVWQYFLKVDECWKDGK